MQLTNQMYAAMAVVGVALVTTVWYILPAGGSYPIESETLSFPAPRAQRTVIPAEAALDPLVPSAAVRRRYNPFNLQVQVHRNEADELGAPPPPPLSAPLPPPRPLPPVE